MRKITKRELYADVRYSEEIDVSLEPDMYFAKLALEYHGSSVRDNTVEQLVEIGMEIERGNSE